MRKGYFVMVQTLLMCLLLIGVIPLMLFAQSGPTAPPLPPPPPPPPWKQAAVTAPTIQGVPESSAQGQSSPESSTPRSIDQISSDSSQIIQIVPPGAQSQASNIPPGQVAQPVGYVPQCPTQKPCIPTACDTSQVSAKIQSLNTTISYFEIALSGALVIIASLGFLVWKDRHVLRKVRETGYSIEQIQQLVKWMRR